MLWSSLLDFHNAAACYSELSGPWHASMQLHLTSYQLKSSVRSSSCTFLSSLHSALLVMWRPPPQMDLTFTFKENTRLPPDCQSFCRSQFFFIRPKILRQRLRLFFCYQIFLAYTDTLKTWEMSRYLEVLRRDTLSLYPSKSGRSPKEMGNGDSTHSIVSSCNCCLSWSISPPHSVTRRQTPLTTSIQCKCNDNKQIYVSFQSKMR